MDIGPEYRTRRRISGKLSCGGLADTRRAIPRVAPRLTPWAVTAAVFSCTLAAPAMPDPPAPTTAPAEGPTHAAAKLVCERTALVPGQPTLIGVSFTIEPGWHLYWDGQNDSGLPISVEITAPPGVEIGPVQWPAPERHVSAGDILDHVYFKRVTLLIPITATPAAAGAAVELAVELNWLVCKGVCIPGSAKTTLTLPIARGPAAPEPSDAATQALFTEAKVRLPADLPPPTDRAPRATLDGASLRLTAPDAAALAFFPASAGSPITDPIRSGEAKGHTLSVTLAPEDGKPARAVGIFEVRRGEGKPREYYRVDLPGKKPAPDPAAVSTTVGHTPSKPQ